MAENEDDEAALLLAGGILDSFPGLKPWGAIVFLRDIRMKVRDFLEGVQAGNSDSKAPHPPFFAVVINKM